MLNITFSIQHLVYNNKGYQYHKKFVMLHCNFGELLSPHYQNWALPCYSWTILHPLIPARILQHRESKLINKYKVYVNLQWAQFSTVKGKLPFKTLLSNRFIWCLLLFWLLILIEVYGVTFKRLKMWDWNGNTDIAID